MNIKAISKHVWCWFAVSVWITGVPQVAKYTVLGVTAAASTTSCLLFDRGCPLDYDASAAEGIAALLDSNPDKDLVMKPRGRK